MNSNNEHHQVNKILEEIKVLNDLQQKNFNDEIQKNKMQISTLEIATTKLELNYGKISGLAEDRKRRIEELNTKIVQLQNQLKTKEKMELEIQKFQDEFLKVLSGRIYKKIQKGPNKVIKEKMSVNYWLGFQHAMVQMRVLYPKLELSEMSVFKEVVDGKLVEVWYDEEAEVGYGNHGVDGAEL